MQLAIAEAKLETEKHGSDRKGIYLEFRGTPGYDMKLLSLENLGNKKTRLCNIRNINQKTVNVGAGEQEEKNVDFAKSIESIDKTAVKTVVQV